MKECLDAAIDAFQDKMSKQDIKAIYENLNAVWDKALNDKDYDTLRKKGVQYLNKRRQTMLKDKFILAQNILDYESIKARVDTVYDNIEKNGASLGSNAAKDTINSILFNDAKYGGLSVESVRKSLLGKYTAFTHELEQAFGLSIKDKIKQKSFRNNVLNAIKDGEMDEPLLKELWNLGNGKPIESKNPTLIKLASIFHKVNEKMSFDKATANPLYRHRKNYGTTLHFDPDRTRSVGFAEYLQDIKDRVDLKEFTDRLEEAGVIVNDNTISDILRTIYDKKTALRSVFETKITDKSLKNVKDPQMLLRNISDGRVFFYKSAEDFAYMFKKYNSGTVYDSTMMSINATTRALALDTVLGKMPLLNLQLAVERVTGKIKDVPTRKQMEIYFKNNLDHLYNIAAGTAVSEDNFYSKNVRRIKSFTTTALMGSAPITAWLTDPAFASGVFSGLSEDNLFSKYFEVNKETIKNFSKERRNTLGKKMDSYLTDVQFGILHHFTGLNLERKEVGTLTKLADFTMGVSTFKLQNIIAKITNDRMHAHAIGEELSFEDGHMNRTPFMDRLRTYGVKDHDFEILKYISKNDDNVLYVQSIRESDIESARKVLSENGIDPMFGYLDNSPLSKKTENETQGIEWTDERVKKYLNVLATKYSSANYDLSRMASPTPNDFTNAVLMGKNTSADNAASAFLHLATQFKSFSGGVLRTYRLMSNEKLVANRLKTVGTMVGLLTAIGGARIMLDDLLNYETPTDPTAFDEDAPILNNFLVRSFMKSGSLPFFADYALTDYARSGGTFSKDLLGPSFKLVEDTLDMAHAVASTVGEDKVKASSIVSPALRWVPLQNLWYSKGFTNKFMLDFIKEGVDPKFKRKKDKIRDKNSGSLWEQQDLTE